jgi:hypothetical protein
MQRIKAKKEATSVCSHRHAEVSKFLKIARVGKAIRNLLFIFSSHFLPNTSLNTLPKILGWLNPEGWRAGHTARMAQKIKMSILFWKYEATSCGIQRQTVAKYFRTKDMRAWPSTVQVSGSSETAKNFEFCKGRKLFWNGCVIICLSIRVTHFWHDGWTSTL